jgi:hypothetical protein
MPIVRPSGAGDEVLGNAEVRNGGTILKGGSNAAGIFTKSLSLAEVADDQGQAFGSKVIAKHAGGSEANFPFTDQAGTIKAQGGASQSGTAGQTELGYKADATEWVVKGGNVTRTLAGTADLSLIGGAAGPDPTRDSTYQIESTRDMGDIDLDIFAAPASGYKSNVTVTGGGVEVNFIRPSGAGDENSSDLAANTTRAVPGQLVYRTGAALPKEDTYKSQEAPNAS